MDDNSEVNMDTDVSSTTADVPEIQEINRESSSQVETVIVVEELDEGTEKEMSSALAKETSQSGSDNEVESCSLSPPNDEVSTNDTGVIPEEKSSAEPVESNNVSPVSEEVEQTSSEFRDTQPQSIQEQVTTTKSSPIKTIECDTKSSSLNTIECAAKSLPEKTIECDKTVDSSNNISPVDSASKEDGKPDVPDITMEKKSPIKKLKMEEIQTTCIEISKTCNDSKKDELSVDICERSNDSQVDSVSDVSEKEHNKSISRELKSLMKSAKESKIISECTQLTTKTRKSRAGLDTSSSASPSIDFEKVQGRRHSTNSQISNSSEHSEKTPMKRSMRSQNPEFVHKVKQFLNSVTGKHQRSESDDEDSEENKKKTELSPTTKKKKQNNQVEELQVMDGKPRSDLYCWRCHWQVEMAPNEKGHSPIHCTVCPRSFHYKCLTATERNKIDPDKSLVCPECMIILQAETSETRSPAMKKITVGELRELLQHAVQRMTELNGVEPFMSPVDRAAFPDYDKYVVNPMDLTVIKDNVSKGVYGSTEAFAADVQWILHNSIIFNTLQSKLTAGARALVRTCRAEMGEIEACPECYAGAHARKPTWFVDVCSTPHILLWAKLKGFPYWPAKGMSVNNSGMVDVRFFGAHDRAWVPAKDCFLYSEKDPNSFKAKRQDIIDSMQEAEDHIRNISRKYGKFVYPPFKTPFEPNTLNEHLKAMIPSFDGEIKSNFKEKANTSVTITPKNKRRSESKSSKSSNHDGDMSEGEENQTTKTRKMADGAEIAKDEEESAVENDNTIEVDTSKKEGDSRKRRRSALEEAVITVMESSSSSKKKRVENESQKEIQNETLNTSVNKGKNDSKKEAKIKKPETPSSSKDVNEPQSSTDKVDKVIENKTPIKTVIKIKASKTSTPKEKADKPVTPKQKPIIDKVNSPDSAKVLRIRVDKDKSKHSSPSSSQIGEKRAERKNSEKKDKDATQTQSKNKETEQNKLNNEKTKENDSKSTKKSKRLGEMTITSESSSLKNNGLPTISSVRSLSTISQTSNITTPTTTSAKTIEISIEPNLKSSSIFTPTSTDSTKNMKEAVNKFEQLRNEKQPGFGKVGVRAFARMTSPEKPKDVEVEIKTEPIDFDDADRQSEKMDLMNVFRLRPVNPSQKLRDVRINKVTAPVPVTTAKTVVKPPEPKPKARKTFPQPRKPDDGRSELNGKNSMVYIPIQPPTTQAPVRQVRPVTATSNAPVLRPPIPTATSSVTNTNTAQSPLVSSVTSTSANPTSSPAVVTKNNMPVGQLPTVHTVPYITSVNGQCYFSLQPIMSVGGVDNPSGAMVSEVPVPSVAQPMPVLQAPALPILNGTVEPDKLPETGELPRLQQRPGYVNPLDVNAPSAVPTPSLAGPITTKLNQHATKMTNFFRTLLEETIEKWDDPTAQLSAAKMQLETVKWKAQQEMKEMKHNFDLTVAEMRSAFEKEKARAVAEAWRSAHVEMEAAVKAAKSKQWCANCNQEAQFYCCWNTAYCDYPCQRAHWSQHFTTCTQERKQDNNNSSNSNTVDKRLQSAPDNVPTLQKSSAAPTLTVGGKVAQVRVQGKDQPGPLSAKSSIIVSMVDDKSGMQTVKCVGTYKAGASQVPPLILNNQINSEEGNQKKVMTSGGYLIVGSGNNAPLVTPRRTQTIQYFQ